MSQVREKAEPAAIVYGQLFTSWIIFFVVKHCDFIPLAVVGFCFVVVVVGSLVVVVGSAVVVMVLVVASSLVAVVGSAVVFVVLVVVDSLVAVVG